MYFMDSLHAEFSRHSNLFFDRKKKKLIIPFFKPVTKRTMNILYSPMQVVR